VRTATVIEDHPAAEILSGNFARAGPVSPALSPARDRLRRAIATLQRRRQDGTPQSASEKWAKIVVIA